MQPIQWLIEFCLINCLTRLCRLCCLLLVLDNWDMYISNHLYAYYGKMIKLKVIILKAFSSVGSIHVRSSEENNVIEIISMLFPFWRIVVFVISRQVLTLVHPVTFKVFLSAACGGPKTVLKDLIRCITFTGKQISCTFMWKSVIVIQYLSLNE